MPILKFYPSEVTLFLSMNGVNTTFEDSDDDLTDPSITINKDLHIQCLQDGDYCLVQQIGDSWKWFPNRTNPSDLLKDIQSIK